MSLVSDIKKLAHEHPEFRKHLLPLITGKKAGVSGPAMAAVNSFVREMEALSGRIKADFKKSGLGSRVESVGFGFDESYYFRMEYTINPDGFDEEATIAFCHKWGIPATEHDIKWSGRYTIEVKVDLPLYGVGG